MTFGDNYLPQNFDPVDVARLQQATYLWNNKPEECLNKYRQYVDTIKLNLKEWDTPPFAQAYPDWLNKVVTDGNGDRLSPGFHAYVDDHLYADVEEYFALSVSTSVVSLDDSFGRSHVF